MSVDTNEIMMSVTLLNFGQHVINMLDVRNSVLLHVSLTVKAAPHECVIRTGQF